MEKSDEWATKNIISFVHILFQFLEENVDYSSKNRIKVG